jgi:undecaprenyl diphosphate synthase
METLVEDMIEEMTLAQEESLFSPHELALLDPRRIPRHVAIAMDGNRRWAKKRFLPAVAGHWKGADALIRTVRAASNLGIKVITVYSFSTENWSRSPDEVHELMYLFKVNLRRQKESMIKEGVKLDTIGDIARFPQELQEVLQETKEATASGDKIELVLALNYGGRDELTRAVRSLVEDIEKGHISKNEVTETLIARYLDTAKWGDPDLLIRTSGEYRLSNFLLWQLSYAEVHFTQTLWPDFKPKDLLAAVLDYQQRGRRLGGG